MENKEPSALEKALLWMLLGAASTIIVGWLIQGHEAEIRLEQTERTLELIN